MTPQRTSLADRLSRRVTLLITSAIKLGGLYLIFKSAASPPIDPLVLAESAFMMSGAQVSEATVLNLIERVFTDRPESTSSTVTIKHEAVPASPPEEPSE